MFKFHQSRFILLLLLLSSSWVQADTSFSQVFVFGDSLSDTGNLSSITGDLSPPYFMNRRSNGQVAVETLAARFGHTAQASLHLIGPEAGSNYAISGARAFGVVPIHLDTQIISFHSNNVSAPADALYVIFIGGNNVRNASGTNWFFAGLKIKAAAAKVRAAIESLSRAGARSFLLVNAANVGLLPETRRAATNNPRLIAHARKLSKQYKKELHKIIRPLENTHGITVTEFDLFTFVNDLVENAGQHGFNNTTDACFNPANLTFHPDCNSGLNFDQFIFFDEVHPTARVHALVGEAMYEALHNTKETGFKSPYLFDFDFQAYISYQDQYYNLPY